MYDEIVKILFVSLQAFQFKLVVVNIKNIGIFAHVDAGKTNLTENFLYLSGKTKQIGSVDKGTSQTDFLPIEKERGISVRSSNVNFVWNGVKVNLIDTPGHTDFSSDVERSLGIVDGAILIISAAEGVQSHTEILWEALCKRKVPTIIFVNKIDRVGVNINNVLDEIRKDLISDLVVLQKVEWYMNQK